MSTVCKRCAKEFTGASCPHCTFTGVDLDALLSAEGARLLHEEDRFAPVALVDVVSGKPLAVVTPLCKVGRDQANDISLSGDRSMSRFHFQISQTGQDYYIEDCGSRNGTFLNGSPIAVPRKLQNGDIVSAGINRYQFCIKSATDNSDVPCVDDHTAAKDTPERVNLTAVEIDEARDSLQKIRSTVNDPLPTVDSSGEETVETNEKMVLPDKITREIRVPESACAAPVAPSENLSKTTATRPEAIDQSSPAAWLDEYLFPEIQRLMSEKERLIGLIEEVRQDIRQIDRKIGSAQSISQALLSASGPELGQAAKQVFDALDWYGELAPNNPFEITLKKAPKIEAVVRIVVCQKEPAAKDFEALVNQQAVVWCQSNNEPKGIMIVQVRPEIQPSQRPPLSRDFLESMRRKKICVVQPTQLLAIYRLVVLSGHDRNHYKELLLTTCGPLAGFVMKPQPDRAAKV